MAETCLICHCIAAAACLCAFPFRRHARLTCACIHPFLFVIRSSKYVEKFADFCSENDILVEMFPLEAIGDTGMVG